MSLPGRLLSHIQFLKNPIFDRTTPLNFCGYKLLRFRDFFGVRESLYPRNRLFSGTRESLYPRNITFMGVIEISIKNHQKWRQNKRISPKFHAIAKVYTRKISERHHSRKFIPAKVNFGPRRSRKFIPAKVSTRESLYQ